MPRASLWSSSLLIALASMVVAPLPSSQAQPAGAAEGPVAPPNPLDLAEGLREHGMSDLALEYLRDLSKEPNLPVAVKDQIPLERAKCQLDAAVEEPDEGTRISLIGEAKEGFLAFVRNPKNVGHKRMPEAFLSLARLTSMDAKAQLSKARGIDVPQLNEQGTNGGEVDDAKEKVKKEAAKARPIFVAASNQLKSAIAQIKAQLEKKPDPVHRKALLQTLYDAEITRGTNQMAMADTYIDPSAKETIDRDAKVDEAQTIFAELMEMPGAPSRVTGVARAWNSECLFVRAKIREAEEDVKRIESARGRGSEDAKRMVRFFRIRRDFVSAIGAANPERTKVEISCRNWIRQYGRQRKALKEAFAVRWYLGFLLRIHGDTFLPKRPKTPPKKPQPPAPLSASARTRYKEAEKLFRLITQTDNEYTQRATRERMYVVRRLMGDAEQTRDFEKTLSELESPKEDVKAKAKARLDLEILKLRSAFTSFEECQMASLIQMARTMDRQKKADKNDVEVKARQQAVVALLQRARELASPKENPADIADVYIRLIYYYETTGHPYEAAVLGEHVARHTKSPGGKSALAGVLALYGYSAATGQAKNLDAERIDAVRKLDRDRAIRLARFLDAKFPNDTATDRARHRLASLLYESQKPVESYDALLKIRAGYEMVSQARLFQGAIVYQMLSAKDSPLDPKRRRGVFRRTTSDLDKLTKPLPSAPEDDVRPYLMARWRLASLYLLQPRVDPAAEKIDPGYVKARKVADELLALIPSYQSLVESNAGTKSLNLDGWELRLLAEDAKVKAALLEGQSLFLKGKYDAAYKAIGGLLADMNRYGPFTEQVKAYFAGARPAIKNEPAPPKKTEPKKKGPEPKKKGANPKKGPEPKKGPAPKKKGKAPAPKKALNPQQVLFVDAQDKPAPKAKADPMPKGKPMPKAAPAAEEKAEETEDPQKQQIRKYAEGVDRFRRDLIVLALKIRVKKGEAEKGIEQLELLKKFGGSIEANIATLEQITAEMASQIMALKRDKKADEAKALSDGFSKLLDKLSKEPGLPVPVQRFLGQSLILVGQYDRAIEILKKVPAPKDPKDLLKPNDIKDAAVKRMVLEYRRAILELIRANRQAKHFEEADQLVAGAMGTKEKPGWAANSLDFRIERANLFEAKGAGATAPREAKKNWGEALREWGTLSNIFRAQVSKGPPQGIGGGNRYLKSQNSFYEMYLYQRRCLIRANLQLLSKDDPKNAPRFQKLYDDAGKAFAELDLVSGYSFTPETRELYHDLMEEMPELKKAYEKAIQSLLPTAKGRAEEREKDAEQMRARAAKLPEGKPDRVKLEDRAKLMSAEAAWMKTWTGGLFSSRPAADGI